MQILSQSRPEPTPIPGVHHATWASHADGLSQLSVWRQRLDPGAATPPHAHPCDEVVLCESGWGELVVDGERRRFNAGSTLVLPRDRLHQIVNAGPQPLEIVGIFGQTPVAVTLPDGEVLDLPWRS